MCPASDAIDDVSEIDSSRRMSVTLIDGRDGLDRLSARELTVCDLVVDGIHAPDITE